MAKMISEFIEEQTTSSVSVNDDYITAYAECAIASSLANAYCEAASYAAFAAENGTHVYQEENIFKAAGRGIKNLWTKFIEWIKRIINRIKGKRNDAKIAKAAEILGAIDDSAEVPVNKVAPAVWMIAFLEIAPDILKAAIIAADAANEEIKKGNFNPDLDEIILINASVKAMSTGNVAGIKYEKISKKLVSYGLDLAAEAGATLKASDIKGLVKKINDKDFDKVMADVDKELEVLKKNVMSQTYLSDMGQTTDQTKEEDKTKQENNAAGNKVLSKFTDFSAQFSACYQKLEDNFAKNYDKMLAEFAKQTKTQDDYKLNRNEPTPKTESFYFV